MKTPNLQQTKNYALFKLDPTNRSVERTKKLFGSMKKHGFMPAYPLHCVKSGNHLVVKDGQHRLTVAQSLGLAVFYVIVESCSASIPELNIAKPWSLFDYASSHKNAGKSDYQTLLEFKDSTRLPLLICVSLLSGESAASGNHRDYLKDGRFTIKPGAMDIAMTVARIVDAAGTHIKWSRNTLFVDAISKCCRAKEFDPETFISRMSANPALLQLQPTRETFLRMVESIYNYRSRNTIPLAFLAAKATKDRNPIKAKAL